MWVVVEGFHINRSFVTGQRLIPETRRTLWCDDTLHFGGLTNNIWKEWYSGNREGKSDLEVETETQQRISFLRLTLMALKWKRTHIEDHLAHYNQTLIIFDTMSFIFIDCVEIPGEWYRTRAPYTCLHKWLRNCASLAQEASIAHDASRIRWKSCRHLFSNK